MQLKTIAKTIDTKINEWISSISDEQLKKDLKKNVLVSGGSICSMLLNEPVNDFDVYIKDLDVLIRLTEYYVKPIGGGGSQDKICIMHPKNTSVLSKPYGNEESLQDIENQYTIALRNLKPNQVKLYFNDDKGGMRVNEGKTDEEYLKYIPVFFSPNAISVSNKIQIVIRFHGDAEIIHKTFDFIHATNYWTHEEGLVTNKPALESILEKQLKYQGSLYPVTSVIRMKKFIKRGWNINAGEIFKIVFNCSDFDLKNPDVLEDQLIGVDVAYFGKLIEVLRGVKSECFTYDYISKIIDKIFNEYDEENSIDK